MPHACVNAAAVGIKTTDHHVVETDQRGQHAHRRDQPKRSVASDRKREPDDVGFAHTPVAVQNRRRTLPIEIARSFNIMWYKFLNSTNACSRDEGPHLSADSNYDIPLI